MTMLRSVADGIVDHLVYTCRDLSAGVADMMRLLGVHPAEGGRHEGVGTHNALVGLGDGCYLEIVAPDPERPEPSLPRWFGLDEPTPSGLVTWAAKSNDLDGLANMAETDGSMLGPVSRGARVRPNGEALTWRVTDPRAERLGGVVPFFIDWEGSAHPSAALAHDCSLVGLELEHPEAARVRRTLERFGLAVEVSDGERPSMRARILSPNGTVTLR